MANKDSTANRIEAFLRNGPADAASIIKSLDISQPTFSRLWPNISRGIAIGAARARQYAIRRQIPGVEDTIPVYQISAKGEIEAFGDLIPLEGDSYVFYSPDGTSHEVFRGLPFFLCDLKPQGFLGRLVPRNNQDLALPESILAWTDDDVLRYLVIRGEALPGNLLLGNQSYLTFLRNGNEHNGFDVVVEASQRASSYPCLVELVMKDGSPGSSAGGEQPKFVVTLDNSRHLIVKFSPPIDTPNGRRWADLLACEHIALDVLNSNGIPAATSSIIDVGGRRFLEVDRFDRTSQGGRLPMITMSGLDGNLGMLDQKWSKAAAELHDHGYLSRENMRRIEVLDLFGSLIGNSDRHHGNIAFSWDRDQNLALLPVYDMLPMFYRPNQHGEVVKNTWELNSKESLVFSHLPFVAGLASKFWDNVLADPLISDDFKAVARAHLDALYQLNSKLKP